MADTPLFQGDVGVLPVDTRRVLVNLLRGPTLDGQRQQQLWTVLLRDEVMIRSRLHDIFLDLVLDNDQKIAFTQQAEADELDMPTLLRKTTLSLRETALILYLRGELSIADTQSERCVVERDQILEHLRAYVPATENDQVRFDKQSDAAIEKLIKLSLLHKLKGSDSRLEVSQAMRILFGVSEIEELTKAYEALKNGPAAVLEATETTELPETDIPKDNSNA